ncbi:MAG: HIT family protein [Pseudomonadota bacterium]
MQILKCELSTEIVENEYNNTLYEIIESTDTTLTIKLYCTAAGGVWYENGRVIAKENSLYFYADQCDNGTIEFELRPWELTYEIELDSKIEADNYYFADKKVSKLDLSINYSIEPYDLFLLDERLKKDCFIISDTDEFIILLMNNSLVPWFIIVPKTDHTELYQLDADTQKKCAYEVNKISKFITSEYNPDKLNVAAIGNIIKQLHIHIVGRFESDPYWPAVVWGNEQKKEYSEYQVDILNDKFLQFELELLSGVI